MNYIDLKAQQEKILPNGQTLREAVDEKIRAVLDHGQYILGPEVTELEHCLNSYVGSKHCIAVASGTDALLIALMALGISLGDEVITTPFSFISTAETIALLGAKPVYVDIVPSTYNLNPVEIERAITSRTKAIVPVSLYGQPADFIAINAIADRYGLPVIEDGAQSFGAQQQERRSCNLSTIGTTSFFPSKPLGGYGDGGACFTNNDELADKMRCISRHGQSRRYFHTQIGLNGRLDTLQAAILLAKLKIFDDEVSTRWCIGSRYTQKLRHYGIETTPYIHPGNISVYAQYTIEVDNRDSFQKLLQAKGIPTSVHYPTILPDQPALKSLSDCATPVAKKACKRVVSLPMHPYLSEQDQDQVISTVAAILT